MLVVSVTNAILDGRRKILRFEAALTHFFFYNFIWSCEKVKNKKVKEGLKILLNWKMDMEIREIVSVVRK